MRPKLRFHDFLQSGFWFKNKLGDEVHSIIAGGDIDREKFTDNGTYPILANALVNDGIIGYYENHYTIKGPAVTVTGRGDIGHAKARNFNFTPVVRLLTIKSKHNIIFLENSINNYKSSFESTGVPQLTIPKLYNYELYFPIHIQEEEMIGNFFKKIDEMIQLQQSKVNKIKDIKSAYLFEMFPKEGERYPKKRFEGFKEEWKMIKMKDVFPTILSGNRLPKTSLESGDTPYILATTENNGVYARINSQTLDYHGNKMKLFDIPSISFSIDNPEAIFLQEEKFFTSNIMRVLINKDLTKEEYIFFMETMRKATDGFDWGVKFSGPVVLDLDIKVPFNKKKNKIDYKEIKKIGEYFHNLDKQISIEEEKLAKLEKLKQAYLNDMFV